MNLTYDWGKYMKVSLDELTKHERTIVENRSPVRKDLVKTNIEHDNRIDKYTKLYRWQTVYLKADYELTLVDTLVYSHIYAFTVSFGACSETADTIADNMGCSSRAVKTSIHHLRDKGLIEIEEHEGFYLDGEYIKQPRALTSVMKIADNYTQYSEQV